MQKLSAYNLAQNNNCGLITCSICGRSYRITEFGTDADCQSNSPSASNPNFCPYCASPFERPLTRARNQEIRDYILDTIRIGMKSDTVLDPETVIDFLCNISDGGFELYDPKFEIYFNSGITYGADNLELLHVTKHVITFRQLGEDSDETIRSERTDGRRGKDVMQLWGRDLKNHICILFKHNEESKDPSKSGGFRVAPYVIDLGLQKN